MKITLQENESKHVLDNTNNLRGRMKNAEIKKLLYAVKGKHSRVKSKALVIHKILKDHQSKVSDRGKRIKLNKSCN